MTDLARYEQHVKQILTASLVGRVVRTEGTTVAVAGFPAPVGAVAAVERYHGVPLTAEVIGFRQDHTILYPLGDIAGVRLGDRVRLVRTCRRIPVGDGLLGRVVSASGDPLDGLPRPEAQQYVPLYRAAPVATQRPRIHQVLVTGVRAIDGLLTCGCGQRLGIFSGPGVGKSVLLGMMTRFCQADAIVIGLIGERGREVNEFLERDLGPEGRRRSVVVVATSDEPALRRIQAAFTATAIAEFFRDQGRNVLLIMDSLTRFALAQREIGLAAGEPPATRGYPPSVFTWLPRLVERAGRSQKGSITAFYSVLVEGDDPTEPVSDAVRGLLDGHFLLSRKLANRGHFPAIDVLESISRLMPDLVSREQLAAAQQIRQWLAALRDYEDLIAVGAYRAGTNPLVDAAQKNKEAVDVFLRQNLTEKADWNQTLTRLLQLAQLNAAGVQPKLASSAKE